MCIFVAFIGIALGIYFQYAKDRQGRAPAPVQPPIQHTQSPRPEMSSSLRLWIVATAALMFIVMLVVLLAATWNSKPSVTKRGNPAPTFERVTQTPSSEKPARTDLKTESFTGWTLGSNGHTWNSASGSDKRDLCRRLASGSRTGNSADFFLGALNALYSTTDSSILNVTLDDATRLIEAGSSALPK